MVESDNRNLSRLAWLSIVSDSVASFGNSFAHSDSKFGNCKTEFKENIQIPMKDRDVSLSTSHRLRGGTHA